MHGEELSRRTEADIKDKWRRIKANKKAFSAKVDRQSAPGTLLPVACACVGGMCVERVWVWVGVCECVRACMCACANVCFCICVFVCVRVLQHKAMHPQPRHLTTKLCLTMFQAKSRPKSRKVF